MVRPSTLMNSSPSAILKPKTFFIPIKFNILTTVNWIKSQPAPITPITSFSMIYGNLSPCKMIDIACFTPSHKGIWAPKAMLSCASLTSRSGRSSILGKEEMGALWKLLPLIRTRKKWASSVWLIVKDFCPITESWPSVPASMWVIYGSLTLVNVF